MKEYILGVDDAGRGPVIGPMIIAGVLFDELASPILKKMGVKDSKQLFPLARERLARHIKSLSKGYEITRILPEEIDNAVNNPTYNLNKLEAAKMALVINNLVRKFDKEDKITVYIDCPSNNISAWKITLMGFLERKDLIIKAEHKCDVNHAECSAASILAKVTRDEEIEMLKRKLKVDFGSGYPADSRTVEFLKENMKKYENTGIFRKSWQTFKNHNGEKKQKKLMEY